MIKVLEYEYWIFSNAKDESDKRSSLFYWCDRLNDRDKGLAMKYVISGDMEDGQQYINIISRDFNLDPIDFPINQDQERIKNDAIYYKRNMVQDVKRKVPIRKDFDKSYDDYMEDMEYKVIWQIRVIDYDERYKIDPEENVGWYHFDPINIEDLQSIYDRDVNDHFPYIENI